MNPTLYQQLSPLGFAEWLEKNFETLMSLDEWFKDADKEEINSSERTVMNALAFRWLREEKKLDLNVLELTSSKYRCSIWHKRKFVYSCESFNTYEEAEHEALNKALEILSKGGENGN